MRACVLCAVIGWQDKVRQHTFPRPGRRHRYNPLPGSSPGLSSCQAARRPEQRGRVCARCDERRAAGFRQAAAAVRESGRRAPGGENRQGVELCLGGTGCIPRPGSARHAMV